MAFRVSFFFKQQTSRLAGWSENYWHDATDLTAVRPIAISLGLQLRNIHGRSAPMQAIRISEATTFRRVDLIRYGSDINVHVAADTETDYPTTALLLKHTSSPDYVVRQWVKGVWDGVVTEKGIFNPSTEYTKRLNAFFLELKTGGWKLRVLNRANPQVVVNNITAAGVATAPGHTLLGGEKVRIRFAKGLTYANRVWRVKDVTANTFALEGWVEAEANGPYKGDAKFIRQTYTFAAIDKTIVDFATSRNVGRPFGLLTGRRKTRKK